MVYSEVLGMRVHQTDSQAFGKNSVVFFLDTGQALYPQQGPGMPPAPPHFCLILTSSTIVFNSELT